MSSPEDSLAHHLTITLLDTPRVLINGEPVTGFVSSKATAVIYYLAATGRTTKRSVLAGLLWGEFPRRLTLKYGWYQNALVTNKRPSRPYMSWCII